MREAALDLDHHGLVVLVADHDPKQNSFRHRCDPYAFAAALFWRATVLMRAISRLICLTRAVFSSWPEAAWKRRLNCSFFSLTNSSSSLSLIHISEPTRRTPISYAVFCLKK